MTDDFAETEQVIGHFVTLSGSIVISDGIHAASLPGNADQHFVIDLGKENTKIPLIATMQNGNKFLLIPVDAAEPLSTNNEETVLIEDPASVMPTEEEASEGPQPK
jgi:hypothetical protein